MQRRGAGTMRRRRDDDREDDEPATTTARGRWRGDDGATARRRRDDGAEMTARRCLDDGATARRWRDDVGSGDDDVGTQMTARRRAHGRKLGAPKSVATTMSLMTRRERHGDDGDDEAGHRSYPHALRSSLPDTRSSRRSLRSSPCFPKNHPSNPHFDSHSDPHFDPHPDPHSDRWLGFSVRRKARTGGTRYAFAGES